MVGTMAIDSDLKLRPKMFLVEGEITMLGHVRL